MKKLILVLILMLSCIFGLTACNDDKTENVEKELSPELKAGQSFIKQLYVNASSETPSDYPVVSAAAKCTVEWTVEVTSGNAEDVKVVVDKDGVVTIDVNEKTATDVLYILTATISYNGETTTLTYERKVPKFQELTYAEYAEKEKGDAVVVKGIVVGILSKAAGDTVDGLFLHTPEGGFYIYGVANTDVTPMTEYKLGQEVRASGTMDIYNGTLEVKDATCEILNATPVTYEAVDYTEAFKNAADTSLEAIGVPQAMLVTLKDVTISDIVESNGYYNFTLGGKTSYVRISSSTCPLNAADTDTFKAQWAAHRGYTADITGVVSIYSGNFYLQPCDANAVVYKSLPQLSEAEKVAYEKDNLVLDVTKFADGAKVQLPVTGGAYSDVAISWASESAEVTVNADGLATVATGGNTVNVKLVATLTLGATTLTKEITFEISAEPDAINTTIGALVANKPTTEKDLVYIVTGTWSAKDGMEPSANTYGNGFLTDEAGNKITIYGLSSSKSCLTYANGAYTYKNAKDFPTLNITDGAVLTVGMVYTVQFDNYSAYLIEVSNEPAAVKTTIADLTTTKPTTEKDLVYVVTGTWSAKDGMEPSANTYGNGFLTDEAGNKITIYGLSSSRTCLTYANGAYAYKNAKDFPTLNITDGAVLTVGMIYTIQYDNYSAYLISVEGGSDTPTPDPEPTPTPDPDQGGIVVNPVADKEYYLSFTQTQKNQELYFVGTMSGYYGATSDDINAAVKVVLVAVDGGFNIKFELNGATKYINAEVSGTHKNFTISNTATSVWAWNSDLNTLTTTCGSDTVFMGTYGTYATFGVSAMSFAETSYVAHLTEAAGTVTPEPTPDPEPTPTPDPNPGETTNSADFETMGASSSSYAARKSTAGWTAENCALNAGGPSDANPNFKVFGTSEDRALTLNGKKSAPGKVLSPVLTGGIKKLTFNYCQLFTDTAFEAEVNIKDANGNVVATKTLAFTSAGTVADKYIVYEFVFELETPVTGEFQIEIINKCPSQVDKNKDRLSIWNLSWESAE